MPGGGHASALPWWLPATLEASVAATRLCHPPFSVSGKRNFAVGEKRCQMTSAIRTQSLQKRAVANTPPIRAYSRVSRKSLQMLDCVVGWKDSNLRIEGYERTSPAAWNAKFFQLPKVTSAPGPQRATMGIRSIDRFETVKSGRRFRGRRIRSAWCRTHRRPLLQQANNKMSGMNASTALVAILRFTRSMTSPTAARCAVSRSYGLLLSVQEVPISRGLFRC
jgi:hypothetical protein